MVQHLPWADDSHSASHKIPLWNVSMLQSHKPTSGLYPEPVQFISQL
jgi:hypothetical protein